MIRRILILSLLVAGVFSGTGCKLWFGSASGSASETVNANPNSLYSVGQQIYTTRCLVCHNEDPHKAGAVGPAIYGSSMALITARLMTGKYPSGYKPKRPTHIMPQMPDLKPEIPAIFAFLNGKH